MRKVDHPLVRSNGIRSQDSTKPESVATYPRRTHPTLCMSSTTIKEECRVPFIVKLSGFEQSLLSQRGNMIIIQGTYCSPPNHANVRTYLKLQAKQTTYVDILKHLVTYVAVRRIKRKSVCSIVFRVISHRGPGHWNITNFVRFCC